MTQAEFRERLAEIRERMRQLAAPVPDRVPAGGLPPKPWQDQDRDEEDEDK